MKYSTRDLATMAVFGTLWGIAEISLGAVLKSLKVPFSGALMAAIGLTIAMVGRLFVSQRGSTLYIGVIAMLLKMFSVGGVVVGPMIGISTEALIAEGVLSLTKSTNRLIFSLAGFLGVLSTLVQPFVTGLLLFGRDPLMVWFDTLDRGSRILGIDAGAVIWVILTLVLLHLFLGGLAGWLAWGIGAGLRRRLGTESEQI